MRIYIYYICIKVYVTYVLHITIENKLQFNIRDKLSNLYNTKVIVKYIKRV